MSRRVLWMGCLAVVLLLSQVGVLRAEVLISSITPGSRRVELEWTPAPEDTFHTAPLSAEEAQQHGIGTAPNVPDYRDAGLCIPSIGEHLFGGYKIWRKAAYESNFVLLRKIGLCDTLYTFGFQDLTRSFVDPDSIYPRVGRFGETDNEPTLPVPGPFNGFDYRYSVTVYEFTKIGSVVYEVDRSTPEESAWPLVIQPNSTADATIPFLDKVRVVPDPFILSTAWSQVPKIQFQNLPQKATVRIYTTAGDLVRVLEHSGGAGGFGSKDWDLKNGNGEDVVPGIYLYHVNTPSGEETSGQFVIIR